MLKLVMFTEGAEPVHAPTWDDVAEAIRSLDGDRWTLVSIEVEGGPSLLVGGGTGGRYIVDYLVDRDTQEDYVLTDPSAEGPDVELVAGGQPGDYPAKWCVPLPLAMAACEHFVNTGSMAPQLTWTTG